MKIAIVRRTVELDEFLEPDGVWNMNSELLHHPEDDPAVFILVGKRRFYGEWIKLQRCITPHRLFSPGPRSFHLKLDDIKLPNGKSHNFGPVGFTFNARHTLWCIDTTVPVTIQAQKAIYRFVADVESTDTHKIEVLTMALHYHGNCIECMAEREKSLYRL